MKNKLKNMVWVTLPIILVAGCAESPPAPSVSYNPALTEPLAPTSDRAPDRVYSEAPAAVGQYAPPPGANSADWAAAEEIRALLTSDPKLGNAPMITVVKSGVVTLRGGVRNDKDRQRLRDEIGRLPGISRVDDEMELKNPLGTVSGETKNN
jgi:BON domain